MDPANVRLRVLVVGEWETPRTPRAKDVNDVSIRTCPAGGDAIIQALRGEVPDWIVFAQGEHETTCHLLLATARQIAPELRFAVLVSGADPDLCDRWFHRGARAFFDSSVETRRLVDCLSFVGTNAIVAIDVTVQQIVEDQQRIASAWLVAAGTAVTPVELRILRQLATGATNRELARRISMKQRTLEFHLTTIYRKLGVSGRVEAIEQARRLGI